MKKLLLTLTFISLSFGINGQKLIKGDIEDLQELTNRKLAVVIFEEDKKYVQKLEKKIAKNNKRKSNFQKELKDYKFQISSFNKNIKELISNYWDLNNTKEVKYYTKKELEKLRKSKSKKYAVLDLTALEINVDIHHFMKMDIYLITYGQSEKKRLKAVFQKPITNLNYNLPPYADKKQKEQIEKLKNEKEGKTKLLSRENLLTTLSIAQRYIKESLKLKDKIKFEDFALTEAKKNCSNLKGKTILIQEANVHGKIQGKLKELFPEGIIKLVSADRITQAIINNEDVLIGLPSIKRFYKAKGSLGGLTAITVIPVSHKMIINAKSKKIVRFYKQSGVTSYLYFKKKDIEKFGEECN